MMSTTLIHGIVLKTTKKEIMSNGI
jgi:hypothetical protein